MNFFLLNESFIYPNCKWQVDVVDVVVVDQADPADVTRTFS